MSPTDFSDLSLQPYAVRLQAPVAPSYGNNSTEMVSGTQVEGKVLGIVIAFLCIALILWIVYTVASGKELGVAWLELLRWLHEERRLLRLYLVEFVSQRAANFLSSLDAEAFRDPGGMA
ncbi:hypothetical protein OF83DRAFT_1168881 [Amylostereum chailletii]|nr:hypothetical protein OF83DRAFT_1168881 [Amylostereum chailletii]